jgi:hypothetical protein
MTTDDIRQQKAMVLLEAYEARDEYRRAEEKLKGWQASAKTASKSLHDALSEGNPEWDTVRRHVLALDAKSLESLVSHHKEATRTLKEATRKLEEYRLELD